MGAKTSVHLESGQKDAFQRMVDDGEADNQSEALRRTVNLGLAELGYLNGKPATNGDTRLRATTRRFADAFALLGLMMVGITWWLPLEMRMYVVAPFGASLACITIDRALKNHEPGFSQLLARVLGGGEKA